MLSLVLLMVMAQPTVRVQTADDRVLESPLVSIDSEQLTIRSGGEPTSFALKQLKSLQMPDAEANVARHTYSLGLRDGTIIGFRQIETGPDGSTATISNDSVGELSTNLNEVRWIRFQMPRQAANERWETFVAEDRPTDTLVIRRSSGALDAVNGVVTGIDQEKVQFDLDGQQIAAPRDRLEGIVFREVSSREAAAPILARVEDVKGSRWAAAELQLSDAEDEANPPRLKITTAGGVSVALPLSMLYRITFSTGIIPLTELQPTSVVHSPFFDLGLSELDASRYVTSRRPDGAAGDLILSGRTQLEYRVPSEAGQFAAGLTLPNPTLPVEFSVRVDGDEATSFTLDADQPRNDVTLDVEGARRIEIAYDGFPAGGVGDRLIVTQPRFIQKQ